MSRLTQQQLAAAQCTTPGCDHSDHAVMFIVPRCHPAEGCEVAYVRAEGTLVVTCNYCSGYICEIAVAPSEVQ